MKSVLMSQYLVTTTLVAVDGHGTCKSLLLFFTAFYFQICLSFVCLLVVIFFFLHTVCWDGLSMLDYKLLWPCCQVVSLFLFRWTLIVNTQKSSQSLQRSFVLIRGESIISW